MNPAPTAADKALQEASQYHAAERLAEAEALYRQVLTVSPAHPVATGRLGLIAHQTGHHAEAVRLLGLAQSLGHRDAQNVMALGFSHQALGQISNAEAAFRSAAAIDRRAPEPYINLGNLLFAQGRFDDALAAFRAALKRAPRHARANFNVGVVLAAKNDAKGAIAAYEAALRADPNLHQAHANLGVLHADAGRFDRAAAAYDAALSIEPNDVETRNNVGILLRDQGKFVDAEAAFRKALEYRPDSADIHRNLGLLYLLSGDYARGWPEYAWRHQCADLAPFERSHGLAAWSGAESPGRRLRVWGEQGLGDQILFASMARDLAGRARDRGFSVTWEIDPRLVAPLRRSCPDIDFVPFDTPVADAGAQLPAGHLGGLFRASIDAFPARPGFIAAESPRQEKFRAQISAGSDRKCVGISWLSRNPHIGALKSGLLSEWCRALGGEDVTLVDLQYGATDSERAAVQGELGIELIHLEDLDLTNDLDGLCALIRACDCVVTTSNTTAHLAGALGVSAAVLVPQSAGKLWYWGHDRDVSPWYPSLRLIRQERAGTWSESLARARAWVDAQPLKGPT